MFDIKEFYLSIKEAVLQKVLQFTKDHTKALKKDIDLIIHARRPLLFNEGETWVKKIDKNFDVTMEANNGAEICELVDIYQFVERELQQKRH